MFPVLKIAVNIVYADLFCGACDKEIKGDGIYVLFLFGSEQGSYAWCGKCYSEALVEAKERNRKT